MHRVLAIVMLLFLFVANSFAQQEGEMHLEGVTTIAEDTVKHSPKMAGYLSMAVPGLGQAYNKKYWKIPIIYAGLGALTYFAIDNHNSYIKYRDAYIARINNEEGSEKIMPQYTTENIRVYKNIYWKDRDFMIIMTAVLYSLNILDAVVDAHFFTYDISDDLSLMLQPSIEPTMGLNRGTATGFGICLQF